MQANVSAQMRPARQCAPASSQLRSPKYRWSSVARASTTAISPQTSDSCSSAYARVKDVALIRCSDGERVPVGSLWGDNDRAVVAFARTFGCPFCWELATQLRRDIKPQLDQQGIKLFLVAIGTHQRSKDFIAATGFPAECLLADPDSSAYEALGLVKGVAQTFFDINTPVSLLQRFASGSTEDLKDILPRWQPWQPPKLDQALQQGGMFIFEGSNCVWCHYDKATAAHTDLKEVVKLATAADCGCAA